MPVDLILTLWTWVTWLGCPYPCILHHLPAVSPRDSYTTAQSIRVLWWMMIPIWQEFERDDQHWKPRVPGSPLTGGMNTRRDRQRFPACLSGYGLFWHTREAGLYVSTFSHKWIVRFTCQSWKTFSLFSPHNYLTSPDEILMFYDFIKNLYFSSTHRFQGCARREPFTGGTVQHDRPL